MFAYRENKQANNSCFNTGNGLHFSTGQVFLTDLLWRLVTGRWAVWEVCWGPDPVLCSAEEGDVGFGRGLRTE